VVSGQDYAEYVTQNIFAPLDMRHSYAARAPALQDGLAQGYAYMFEHPFRVEEPLLPARLPSGYLIASVEDLAHYAISHLNQGRYGDRILLSPQGMAELHAPAVPVGREVSYAMGWQVGRLEGEPYLEHGGVLRSFRSQIVLLPESGRGVILLANAHGFEQLSQVTELAKGVLRLLNGKPAAPVTLPFRLRFLYWAVLLAPVLLTAGMVYSWQFRRNKGIVHLLLVVLLYSGLATLWLILLPRLMGASIGSIVRAEIFYRELAGGVVASAVLGIGWSVIYTAMNLRARRAN